MCPYTPFILGSSHNTITMGLSPAQTRWNRATIYSSVSHNCSVSCDSITRCEYYIILDVYISIIEIHTQHHVMYGKPVQDCVPRLRGKRLNPIFHNEHESLIKTLSNLFNNLKWFKVFKQNKHYLYTTTKNNYFNGFQIYEFYFSFSSILFLTFIQK